MSEPYVASSRMSKYDIKSPTELQNPGTSGESIARFSGLKSGHYTQTSKRTVDFNGIRNMACDGTTKGELETGFRRINALPIAEKKAFLDGLSRLSPDNQYDVVWLIGNDRLANQMLKENWSARSEVDRTRLAQMYVAANIKLDFVIRRLSPDQARAISRSYADNQEHAASPRPQMTEILSTSQGELQKRLENLAANLGVKK